MRSFIRALGVAATLAVLSLSATAARAGVVLENDFSTVTTLNTTVNSGTIFGTGFTTGTSPATLSFLSASFVLGKTGTSASVTPIVQLFTGSAGSPGTLVSALSLSGPAITSTSPVAYDFAASGPVTLLPSTSYFLTLAPSAGELFQWYLADAAPGEANSSGWSETNGIRSTNAGSSWGSNLPASLGSVSIQAVPEPSTIVMACIGVTGAVALDAKRRRRRRATVESEEASA